MSLGERRGFLPEPAVAPVVPSAPAPQAAKTAPAVARKPAAAATATKPAAAKPAAKPAAAPVAAPAARTTAPPTLDLNALKDRLRATKAIGVFTKISLKNKVDDFLDQFSAYYQGKLGVTMAELRQAYNLLMMKVLSLLQDNDQPLALEIVSSREAIWGLLANPTTFATTVQS